MSLLLSPTRLAALLLLFGLFLVELVKSAGRVAIAAVQPPAHLQPAVVAVPIGLRSDLGIATLANMITLTPGTTTLHVSEDRDALYVHVLDTDSTEQTVASIKDGFETLIRRIEG